MALTFGSARSDENYKANSGKAGDQRQRSNTNDTAGEVSMQADYDHSKGWRLFRPIDPVKANKLADQMVKACNNKCIGYDQYQRTTLMSYLKSHMTNDVANVSLDCETDCAQLIRALVWIVYGVDLNQYASDGNFYTGNAASALIKSGLFREVTYTGKSSTVQYNGDIKVTKTKGHIGMICKGAPRQAASPAPSGSIYSGALPCLPTRGYYKAGDGFVTLNTSLARTNITYLQKFLNWAVDAALDVDGCYGVKTAAAVTAFQVRAKAHYIDGEFGTESLALAQKFRK